MEESSSKKGRIVVAFAFVSVITLFALFLKDIMIPFIRLEIANDLDGASELLRSRGVLGFLSVTLVEALQMVVVFIPAEFIQISSGLSYPFPVALLLCNLGVCLGATIIFILVRFFHISTSAYEKRRVKIDRLSAATHDRNTVFLLYLLFFMPLVPFGAICYYGSGTKLRYRRYILTVATGVIPSIVVSNLMGTAGKAFIVNDLPFWLLVLIIVVLAAILFMIVWIFIRRFYLKGTEGTPDSPVYQLVFFITRLWHGSLRRVKVNDKLMQDINAPYVMLSNHESFFDFLYLSKLPHPRNPNFLINEYYCTRPVLKRMARSAGFVSKKLFVTETRPALGMFRTIRSGYPLILFPEGRLSPDGRSNPCLPGGAFYRKLGCPLVLTRIDGAYLANPKWRKRRFKTPVTVTVEKVLTKEELRDMTAEEIDRLVEKTLYNDASATRTGHYIQPDKAKGLENILYRCVDCGELYTTRGIGNELVCTSCGSRHAIDRHYRFTDRTESIPHCYDLIKELEKPGLETFHLQTKVHTRIYGADGGPVRKERGECTLTPQGFRYVSESGRECFRAMEEMPALAFSCGQEFELYFDGELHYFYPDENRQQTARWALLVDMIQERKKRNEEENTDQHL